MPPYTTPLAPLPTFNIYNINLLIRMNVYVFSVCILYTMLYTNDRAIV